MLYHDIPIPSLSRISPDHCSHFRPPINTLIQHAFKYLRIQYTLPYSRQSFTILPGPIFGRVYLPPFPATSTHNPLSPFYVPSIFPLCPHVMHILILSSPFYLVRINL